jgi:putative membrane protein
MLLIRWFISTVAVLIAAYLIPNISVSNWWTAAWLVLFLALINAVIKPILIILTLPINILTLGLFTWVINAGLVLFAGSLIKGFEVGGFWSALGFSLLMSMFTYISSRMTRDGDSGW